MVLFFYFSITSERVSLTHAVRQIDTNMGMAISLMPCSSWGFTSCQVQFFPRKRRVFRVLAFLCLRFHGMLSSCRPWFYLKQVNDYRDWEVMLNRQSRWLFLIKWSRIYLAWNERVLELNVSNYLLYHTVWWDMVVLTQPCCDCCLMASFGCMFTHLCFEVDQ